MRNNQNYDSMKLVYGKAEEDIDILLKKRSDETFWMKANFQVMRNWIQVNEDERQKVNRLIYEAELAEFGFNEAEARCSLKNNLEFDACKIVLDDVFPGFIKRTTNTLGYSKKIKIFKKKIDCQS